MSESMHAECKSQIGFLAPNPKGLGTYNLGSVRTSVRPYVRTSVDSDFSEMYMDQIV